MGKKDITLENTVSSKKNLVTSSIDNEIVMMSVERGSYYTLNGMGSKIWHLIKKPTIVKNICAVLSSEYDIEHSLCQKEVLSFLNDMEKNELLDIC
tara:strand:+ start:75 stop:362 length:288 start_codon:yes stop_codon:yes gene_type:complete